MRMDDKYITLSNGSRGLIRSAAAGDAAAVCAHLTAVSSETPYILQTAEETDVGRRVQARYLRRRAASPGRISLCAFVEGNLAGMATVSPYGELYRTAHRGTMSISVRKAYWGLGLGSALMEELVAFARHCGYAQLELSVDAQNGRAIRLYEKFGFTVCGRVPAALRQEGERYNDELLMVKPLR